ncbi:MAG: apolipoprotein N-acyltransferase [Flavobacteriales bacterium]|nr:apolipoprotein N-acyltransferase [Flavobacteriales bacterium]
MAPTRSRIILWSALSGLLWALAWPAIGGLSWLAFVAWLPLLHAERLHNARTRDRPRAFYPYVLIATFIWNLSCSFWFFEVSEPISTKLVSVSAPVLVNTLLMGIPWWLKRIAHRLHGPVFARVAFVAFWLAFERLHHGWDLQWPWFTMGNVFGADPAMAQWYEVTGVLGGSLWILLVNLLIDHTLVTWRGSKRTMNVAVSALVIAVPVVISVVRFKTYSTAGMRTTEVVVVQPNVDPYTEKFGGMDPMEQLDRMLSLAEERITDSTRLIIFPETALQEGGTVDMSTGAMRFHGLWENDLEASASVRRLRAFRLAHPQAAMLVGMNSDRWYRDGDRPLTARELGDGRHWYEAYNAALWMPMQGPLYSYHKSKLVAGPETMPFESVLGPLGDLALDLGGTTGTLGQQTERTVLRDPSSGLAIAPAICYESVFGEHVAAHVRNGAQLIAVITNDGWWDDSPGYRQHLTFSSLRAIETRRDVVRSANTGISCTVDQRGVVANRTAWWKPAAFRAIVHLNDRITFFTRHGDLIGRAAVVITIIALLVLIASTIRRRRSIQRNAAGE